MSEENIVTVKGNSYGEVFALDKDTGLVTYANISPESRLAALWNETLQWLPVKNISICKSYESINYLTIELTTGEVVRLCDKGISAGKKTLYKGIAYLSIGKWL